MDTFGKFSPCCGHGRPFREFFPFRENRSFNSLLDATKVYPSVINRHDSLCRSAVEKLVEKYTEEERYIVSGTMVVLSIEQMRK